MEKQESPTAQKSRTGLQRLVHATRYSADGLKLALGEPAFRLEAMLACVMIPAAFWLGRSWLEIVLLLLVVCWVLVTELLNTGIEKAIDRIGPEWHALSKMAKDVGSAAVFVTLALCAGVWGSLIWIRLLA